MAPVGKGSLGSRNSFGKAKPKGQFPHSYKSTKSLPVEFRLMESAGSQSSEVAEHSNGGSSLNGSNKRAEDGVDNFEQVIDDSPYGFISESVEERTSVGDEGLEAGAASLPSVSSSLAESKWNDTASFAKKKNLQSWYQFSDGSWGLGKILSISRNETTISFPEGKVIKAPTDSLLPANPDILDGVEDLMQLSYLNEPTVLHNLQYRYDRDLIYTKGGLVLVAINPFKKVPLYGNDYIGAYKRKSTENHMYMPLLIPPFGK